MLRIHNLHVTVDGSEILHGIDLMIEPGERHVVMGPNGSGKSSLAATLAGHPTYTVTSGHMLLGTENLLVMKPEDRARHGLLLALQQPTEVAGVVIRNFLRASVNAIRSARNEDPLSIRRLRLAATDAFRVVGLPLSFLDRSVNEHFSGGEKKRFEIAQLLLLQPRLSILDETDSGLDVDAIRTIGAVLRDRLNADQSLLVITHYPRLLRWIKPTHVHLLVDGRIVQSGGPDLAERIERDGYEWLKESNA